MIILHGENEVASRTKLAQLLTTAKERGQALVRLPAGELTRRALESALRQQTFFDTETLLVIEELHSLPPSAKRQALLDLLATEQKQVNLVLWEKKPLTANQLARFTQAEKQLFKTSRSVSTWLASLGEAKQLARQLHLLQIAKREEGAQLCFIFLARQVRLLIQVCADTPLSGPSWLQQKLRQQSGYFSLTQLITFHHHLLSLDWAEKTGRAPLSLDFQLDLSLIQLYSKRAD